MILWLCMGLSLNCASLKNSLDIDPEVYNAGLTRTIYLPTTVENIQGIQYVYVNNLYWLIKYG